MKILMLGAGKLGFPVGCVLADSDMDVVFCDVNRSLLDRYKAGDFPTQEAGLAEVFDRVKDRLTYIPEPTVEVLQGVDFIFVAVQTPHAPEQDGSCRFQHVRKNFDTSFLEATLLFLGNKLRHVSDPKTVGVISTVLPGTMRPMLPLIPAPHTVVYTPAFIAMGTVVRDFREPEFWLLGHAGSPRAVDKALQVYDRVNPTKPVQLMSLESAELTKVCYNTWITMKITLANLVMELAHRLGPPADCDEVSRTLQRATDRIVSPAYMQAGMVDGGACHPRDNIALSWLSDKLGMPYNLFDTMMTIRERQVEFLADLIAENEMKPPIMLHGKEFKAGTRITAGSGAVLLYNILEERGVPVLFSSGAPSEKEVTSHVLTVNDLAYLDWPWTPQDTILDPWNLTRGKSLNGATVIRVGRV